MIRVGVFGASGYMGGELIRILLNHPEVELAWASSRKPGPIENFHPNLYAQGIELLHPDDISVEKISICDLVFMALPASVTLEITPRLLEAGCRVIDLGATFRLDSQTVWEEIYAQSHTQWSLAEEAIYGMSEFHFNEIKQARLVANPGCFSSAAILGLAPLLMHELVDTRRLVVNGLSGTAGMGAELSRAAHHPEISNNLLPYNVVDHRHSYEMEQELSRLTDSEVCIHFTPTYVPITRGILNICHAFSLQTITREALLTLYRDIYKDHPFIKIYNLPADKNDSWQYRSYPWVSSVSGSNYCYIGLDVDEKRNRIVIFSVLDNLGKGGAQVAIENMNLMFGLDRRSGLQSFGQHPH
ncbi:N-acetyl-gamma-glutamyl-phosphate reductase [hydrothermal vent metagenome]|uniref:N-acetyl-gamma-glutamyl-phosphate reductase n=1 Tax=hydrothermal vent metagenome TaxID=652676 RepID=A0A3B1ANM0_9ZZZZ